MGHLNLKQGINQLLFVTILCSTNIEPVYSCVRTSDTGVTTVTVTAATVTVAPVTTAATGSDCNSCTKGQIEARTDPNDQVNGHLPVIADPASQGGCLTIHISCTPINNNPSSFLNFQDTIGGPAPPEDPSQATLTCNAQGMWAFTQGGTSTVITAASCLG